MAVFKAIAGDTVTKLFITCKDGDTKLPIDLTNTTVRAKWKIDSGSLVTRVMTINAPASAGIVEYQFLTGELIAGYMTGEVEITDNATSKVNTSQKFNIDIESKV